MFSRRFTNCDYYDPKACSRTPNDWKHLSTPLRKRKRRGWRICNCYKVCCDVPQLSKSGGSCVFLQESCSKFPKMSQKYQRSICKSFGGGLENVIFFLWSIPRFLGFSLCLSEILCLRERLPLSELSLNRGGLLKKVIPCYGKSVK